MLLVFNGDKRIYNRTAQNTRILVWQLVINPSRWSLHADTLAGIKRFSFLFMGGHTGSVMLMYVTCFILFFKGQLRILVKLPRRYPYQLSK